MAREGPHNDFTEVDSGAHITEEPQAWSSRSSGRLRRLISAAIWPVAPLILHNIYYAKYEPLPIPNTVTNASATHLSAWRRENAPSSASRDSSGSPSRRHQAVPVSSSCWNFARLSPRDKPNFLAASSRQSAGGTRLSA